LTTVIDGKQLSETIRAEIADAVKKLTDAGRIPPGLAVVIEREAGNQRVKDIATAVRRLRAY